MHNVHIIHIVGFEFLLGIFEREVNMNFLFVALGGALGAVARYAISLIPVKTEFPVLTLITNIVGAVLIGFIVGVTSSREGVSDNTVLFWKTGVCGGFTTFSTFSLEAFNLFENKQYAIGGIYVALSFTCCIIGVLCGKRLASIVRI
jgi:CrcB protein